MCWRGDRPETVGEMLELFYAGDIAENRRRPEVVRDAFDRDLLPLLGKRKLDPPVPASVIADAIRAIVKRPAATYAGRCFQILNQAFDWAQANAYIDYNPCQPLRAARLGVVNGKRDRTPDAAELREILLAIDAAQRMSSTIKLALKVVMHTLVRVGELCAAQWSDVDLERGLWRIPATNSKSARNCVVPLTPSVVEMFRTLQVMWKARLGCSPLKLPQTATWAGKVYGKAYSVCSRRQDGMERRCSISNPAPCMTSAEQEGPGLKTCA